MEPMKPMKPMAPMQPMEPMKPMEAMKAWWPEELGSPSSAGSQNDMRYAFFPDRQRLLVEVNGERSTYDSAGHRISGVSQQHGASQSLAFSSPEGVVELVKLKKI